MTMLSFILSDIEQQLGWAPLLKNVRQVSGGCISDCYLFEEYPEQLKSQALFLKVLHKKALRMFQAEAAGLSVLRKGVQHSSRARGLIIPKVFCTGETENAAYIAMQAIRFAPAGNTSYRQFGELLAYLHRFKSQQYGSKINNTIGSTPQNNQASNSWYDFWRKHRLGAQLLLAQKNGADSDVIDLGFRLSEQMEALFTTMPSASCLHGDLWQGNWGFDLSGNPVIFDPAHYFGDRETDIAMSKLFGQAPADFYAAYHAHYPLKEDYALRETFYNSYHILNHFNLFGGDYQQQAKRMMQQVLSALL